MLRIYIYIYGCDLAPHHIITVHICHLRHLTHQVSIWDGSRLWSFQRRDTCHVLAMASDQRRSTRPQKAMEAMEAMQRGLGP